MFNFVIMYIPYIQSTKYFNIYHIRSEFTKRRVNSLQACENIMNHSGFMWKSKWVKSRWCKHDFIWADAGHSSFAF